jgi:hypothetical protein
MPRLTASPERENFGDGISAILTTVGEDPGIKRPALATRLLLGIAPESPEATAKKEALAADLHYLIQIGYVVEFQNGALELPPTKKEAQQQAQQQPDEKEEITAEGEESETAPESSEAADAIRIAGSGLPNPPPRDHLAAGIARCAKGEPRQLEQGAWVASTRSSRVRIVFPRSQEAASHPVAVLRRGCPIPCPC